MELYRNIVLFVTIIMIGISVYTPPIAMYFEEGYSKFMKIFYFLITSVLYTIFLVAALADKASIIETDERYEVAQIMNNEVICINENNELIVKTLYDINYDENAETLYAIKISLQRDFDLKIPLLKNDKEIKSWFRIYTNDKSYVEEQSIYYKSD